MVFDVLAEVEASLVELTGYRFGLHVLRSHPRVMAAEDIEGSVQELLEGAGLLDLGEAFHPFFVLDALHLETGHQFALHLMDLGGDDHARILQH